MGKASRDKGKRFERKIAILLRPLWNTWRGAGQSRRGDDAADVEHSPYWIECKHEKMWPSIPRAWKQAEAATDGRPILVVTHKDRGPTLATLELSEFIKLCGKDAANDEKSLDNE